MKSKFRDIIIISTIVLISIVGFFMFRSYFSNKTHDKAQVKYNGHVVATVYFKDQRVVNESEEEDEYPIINEDDQTITVLGNPQGNVRYEVVIKYNFKKRSMQIIDEKSPKKLCTKEGEKTSGSIICLPNGITILFLDEGEDDFDGIV